MGGHHDLRQTAQRRIFRARFGFINIHRRAGHFAAFNCGHEVGFVNDAAAGAVDEVHAVFHSREGFGVDHVPRLIGERHVHGDKIRSREKFPLLQQFYLQLACFAQRKKWIVSQDAHPKGNRPPRHLRADAAHPANAQHFAAKLCARERFAIPFAAFHGHVGLGNFARQRHHHRKRQLGSRDGVAARRVHHHDALTGGVIHVHVVHPHPSATHHAELGCFGHHLGRHLGGRSHNDRLGLGQQFIGQPAVHYHHIQLRRGFKTGHAFRGNIIANKYSHWRRSLRTARGSVKPRRPVC